MTAPLLSYDITLEEHHGIMVLRDDLLPGGTKARFIEHLIPPGVAEVVYASPVYGGFQIALAAACKRLGVRATIFCAYRKQAHPNTLLAKEYGATVYQVKHGYLSHVESKAKKYCLQTGAHKLTFGANYPIAINSIAQTMRAITKQLGYEPSQVWCAWGSGTLTRGILAGTTKATVNAVVVGMEPAAEWQSAHRLILRKSPFKFDQPYKGAFKPPFPSMPNYDAKAWAYMQECAPVGKVLFWNVL